MQGNLLYSLGLKVKEEKDMNLELVSSVGELLGKTLEVEFHIQEAKDIPHKWSNEVFAEY